MCWQLLVTEIRAKKLALARLDPQGGMPILPPAGAPPAAIDAVERRLGRPLPPTYREFLAQHDGVPGFYQGARLLGARALARGTYAALARLYGDPERDASLFPFGLDGAADVIFAWDLGGAARDGEIEIVVWMNEVGERVQSFPGFLELVLEMLDADIAERRALRARTSRPHALEAGPHASWRVQAA